MFLLNLALIAARATRTLDADFWNYWHFVYAGVLVHTATGSVLRAVAAACLTAFVVLKLADWTAPAVAKHFGLEGIALPHTESVNWAPLMFGLARLTRSLPGGDVDSAAIRRRYGWLGEPLVVGAGLGALWGAVGALPHWKAHAFGLGLRAVGTLTVTMAAVLLLLPKAVALFMEGILPLAEAARDSLQARFPGRPLLVGLDAAVVVGQPANVAIALLCVPIVLVLAALLPGNRVLPFADLTALPFYVIWGVAAARGSLVRGLIHSVVLLVVVLWIGTSLGPITTAVASAVGLRPEGAAPAVWSSLALGSHVIPWIVLQLFQPEGPTFVWGVGAAVAYAAVWWWVRKDVR